MGRIKKTARNIAVGYISNIVAALLGFILRTVFIMRLDKTLLGVNGLYSSILNLLSLADLGIGTAFNYSLYGPMARGEIETIKSYMKVYKKAYDVIAAVIGGIGIALIPFLPYIVRGADSLTRTQLTVYYLIFLFNTVSTYFVSYKYSLCLAEQKDYIQTNVLMITKIVTVLLQIAVILLTSNFLLFLLTSSAVQLLQIFAVNSMLNKMYPYLKDRNIRPLEADKKNEIVTKTKALMLHRIGEAACHQTDSIIISSCISVAVVGLVDNYNLIINNVSNFVNIIFSSAITGFGNLIATESKEKQYSAFRTYRFAAIWGYGFTAVGFYLLITPLITLWLGTKWALGNTVIAVVLANYYFMGERIALIYYKTAAGVFEPDKYVTLIEGAVNLVLSVLLVLKVGLVGVYIGTLVSGLVVSIIEPFIVYKYCFDRKVGNYFLESFKYILVMGLELAVLIPVRNCILSELTIVRFIIVFIIICVVFNLIFLMFFGRTNECKYIISLIKGKFGKERHEYKKCAEYDKIKKSGNNIRR